MKNVKNKVIGGVLFSVLIAGVYSFASNESNDPKEKKYEVIRSQAGEVITHDTIIPFNSTYTEQDYLNDLGYGDDAHIEIINLLEVEKFDSEHKMMFIAMNSDVVSQGNEELKIEKHIVMDDEMGEMIIEIQNEIENLNVDSIVKVFHTQFEDENGNFIIKEMIFHDSMMVDFDFEIETLDSALQMLEFQMEGLDIEMMELHMMDSLHIIEKIEMDINGADFHRVIDKEGTRVEIAVFGDNVKEDFTILIVSNPGNKEHANGVLELKNNNTQMTMYPNPATKSTTVKFKFIDEAKTEIMVTDINGKQVDKIKLGKTKGEVSHTLDIEEWSKGVYFVQVIHGNEKLIEKLVIE